MSKIGFPNNNVYFNFIINRKNWKKLCEHPNLGVAPIMQEFHANLLDMVYSPMFVQGVWVPFDSVTINRAFALNDVDSKEYKAMFREPNYI